MKLKLSIRKDPKEELTVISCKKCGRAWQVTESDAKEFMEHKELCAKCRNKAKERMSLLKPYTNFDRINDMSVEEKANFIDDITRHCANDECEHCPLNGAQPCDVFSITQWLESEAE